MQILGSEPDEKFLEYICSWIRQFNSGEAEALIFASKRACLMVGKPSSTYKWLVFWNPRNNTHKPVFNPTQWYDWGAVPKAQRPVILKSFKQWQAQIDDTALKEVAPFSQRWQRQIG